MWGTLRALEGLKNELMLDVDKILHNFGFIFWVCHSFRVHIKRNPSLEYPNRFHLIVSRVKLLLNRQTGEAVAMKMVDLKKHPDAANSVKKEVCIQKILQDPHILRYFGKRSQGDIEYIFLEYASGGELFDRIGEY